MKTIERKSMLYKTKVEYGDYTMNHVLGCSHGCKYPCYAMQMAKRFGRVDGYEDWCEPVIVSNTLELLDREIPKLKDKIKNVQLCFMTDPFMRGQREVQRMSIEAMTMLNAAGIPVTTLTKGVYPAEIQKAYRSNPDNWYGISLVSLDEVFREKYEPGTHRFMYRISGLRAIHDRGGKTWVSMEPYPTPNIVDQDIHELLESVAFVDKIVFGRWNYNRKISEFPNAKAWYNEQADIVENFCRDHGIQCIIKKGTRTD